MTTFNKRVGKNNSVSVKGKVKDRACKTAMICAFSLTLTISSLTGCGYYASTNTNNLSSESDNSKDESTSSIISMVNNFPKDGKFKLCYNTAKILPTDNINVYNSLEFNEDNKVGFTCYSDIKTDGSQDVYIESSSIDGWADGVMYLVINYDYTSSELKKLSNPIVVPFEVRNDLTSPTLQASIDKDGIFKLTWDSVPDAVGYNVYKKESDEKAELLAELGAEATSWNDWLLDGTDGLVGSSKYDLVSQNSGLNADDVYYIDYVNKAGEHSGISNYINVADYADEIPYKIVDDYRLGVGERVKSTKDLPRNANVEMLSGDVFKYSAIFKLDESTRFKSEIYYNYYITGTKLRGYIEVDPDYVTYMPSEIRNGIEVYSDSLDVKFNVSKSRALYEKEFNLNEYIEINTYNTESEGNEAENPTEYLRSNLLNFNRDIDLSKYGELQNTTYLKKVLTDLVTKDAYINCIVSFRYYEDNKVLHVVYSGDSDELRANRDKLNDKINSILNSEIRAEEITDSRQLEDSIYKYINDNYTYSNKASDIFDMVLGDSHIGNAVSYSKLFNMLANKAGLSCETVVGRLRGVPHTWNIVKLDNYIGYVDCTNNVKNTGLIKICYNMNPEYAREFGYVAKKGYLESLDLGELAELKDNSIEYYTENNLVANNIKEYIDILNRELDNGKSIITVRYAGDEIPSAYVITGISKLFKDRGEELRLKDLKFGDGLGYYVIWFESN